LALFPTEGREFHHFLRHLSDFQAFLFRLELCETSSICFSEEMPNRSPDACRFHGSLEVNKIDANLHVIQGKVLPLPMGHAHIGLIGHMNYSHRINHFSFGEPAIGIVSPLDGDERVTGVGWLCYFFLLELYIFF
jgi:hypothetical protein